MKRLVTFPVILPLRIVALQLRLARAGAEMALDVARELAGAAPWAQPDEDDVRAAAAPRAAAPQPPVPPRAAAAEEAAPARPRATRRAGTQPAGKKTAAARPRRTPGQAATPPSEGEAARPRPRRAARKASAAKPARERAAGPTRADAAAIREANREAEAAEHAPGPGPEVRVAAPWEGYDAMPLDEVLGRLQDADEVLLAAVRLYETERENRQMILLATEPS
jgi:hypothetical protein